VKIFWGFWKNLVGEVGKSCTSAFLKGIAVKLRGVLEIRKLEKVSPPFKGGENIMN